MTPLDALLDRGDDSARARLADNLAAGIPLPRALAAALGIRSSGRPWVEAWAALAEARRVDLELDAVCKEAARKDDAAGPTVDAGRVANSGGSEPDGSVCGRSDRVGDVGLRGSEAGDGGEAEGPRATEGVSDDRSEQGAGKMPAVGSDGAAREPASDVQSVGNGLRPAGRDPDRHLDPGRRGRETGEEAEAGGGHEGVGQVSAAKPDSQGGASGDRATAIAPRLSFAARVAALMPRAPASANKAARIEIVEDYSDDFVRVMAEARDEFGGGRLGLLKWIDRRGQMMTPALHALDIEWIGAFERYYDSGRLIMLDRKGLRAGGSSSACTALTRCALFAPRKLDAGTIGVVPIMSASRDEADGRFVTIRSYLRAAGLTPPKKKGADDDDPDEDGVRYEVPHGGITGTFRSRRSTSGGGVIAIQDRHGHRIQFRILPALVKHGIGYTGATGLADESDLWPDDPDHHVNPAERILDRISERFTTTYDERALTDPTIDPGAEMLIFSASYNPTSAHKRAVDEALKGGAEKRDGSPAALTHLTRLGVRGAAKDEVSRRRLAHSIGSTDSRLLAPGDPLSPDLPAWVFNPIEASIEKCYTFSKGDLSRMLAKYGGRAEENARLVATMTLEDAQYMARANVALQKPYDPRHRSDDGLFDYTGIPGADDAAPARRRGL